ncbi:MAG TPA: class I SAM-dependent rRNA methyltransferase [Chitinophagaceae bacterium]|nr:class I SAM-dependent rRNA methyltransferase [Chitinophagaceae bacterium]
MALPRLKLKNTVRSRIIDGHPWVYANEVAALEGQPEPGSIVEVFTYTGNFIGKGFINPRSQILVRILTWDAGEQIDQAFFQNRLREAWEYRVRLGFTENCRLVFGEADGLPGLIIDKYNDYLVIQTLALGMDIRKSLITEVLSGLFKPRGIYERNDAPVRELEGLPLQKGYLSAPFDPRIILREHGLQFIADLENGQKTGYFLDQHNNRKALQHLAAGADVLDVFCYTGSFSCHAAHYGASRVLGLDISGEAITLARENARLNGLEDRCEFREGNAFDELKQWNKESRMFDIVLLDPPSFSRKRENISKAIAGYKEINLRGIKMVRPGGFLVTSSCTGLISQDIFLQTIGQAAKDAHRTLRQVVFGTQSPDHPVIWQIDSTRYLKFLIAEVK